MPEETLPEAPWEMGAPPAGRTCWAWRPTGLHDLPAARRGFRDRVTRGLDGIAPQIGDSLEDVVMALDELMSNALRHGRAPVEVEVCATDDGLLLLVSDRAAEDPPRPTSTRDPALGGMGLGIVARASAASGWFPRGDVKVVWAVIPERPDRG